MISSKLYLTGMQKILITNKTVVFILFLALGSCSTGNYVLADKNNDKYYLIEYINMLEKNGIVTYSPLIVIDGMTYDVSANKLQISKIDIGKIEYIQKDSDIAFQIYGDKGKNGVLLISTKNEDTVTDPFSDSKVLFLVGKKQVTQLDIQKIDPNDIEFVEIINDKSAIRKYTSADYDGVVIITMKKNGTKSDSDPQ
jgi:hypothetical protein